MHGVVSLLDDTYYRLVETLWAELDRRFGLRGITVTPYPHFSYHVAGEYDLERLLPILEKRAWQTRPFTVKTGGLGLFTGPQPVLYVPVVRHAQLTALHQLLWPALEPCSAGRVAYYAPDNWFPHVTLAHGDLTNDNLGPAVQWLNRQPLVWEFTVDNLSLIYDDGRRQTLHHRFSLK
ncbi:MAG: 2'-5' RNA ligase family protein [Chloroflexi bacterium]|nr:2'-5' RNA ligase family protein [Chloroflexota bacterium]MCI0576249.1 2'-5' RNA ligase family protein [Chloroflexota bacterium]MCI0644555.1 2'-5' RNA ligase family protein [Chloroflexota bacterium]MCI0728756.1 2'-5' RNA ligase family protein [Chloroflexota bacterium]